MESLGLYCELMREELSLHRENPDEGLETMKTSVEWVSIAVTEISDFPLFFYLQKLSVPYCIEQKLNIEINKWLRNQYT